MRFIAYPSLWQREPLWSEVERIAAGGPFPLSPRKEVYIPELPPLALWHAGCREWERGAEQCKGGGRLAVHTCLHMLADTLNVTRHPGADMVGCSHRSRRETALLLWRVQWQLAKRQPALPPHSSQRQPAALFVPRTIRCSPVQLSAAGQARGMLGRTGQTAGRICGFSNIGQPSEVP